MTKDNHSLGRFELTGIPMAPRGVPQIEITFAIDANGILSCTAQEKGTGKTESITITAEKGRLSEAEMEEMVRAAEEYAAEDTMIQERMEARLGLESYLYGAQRTLDDNDAAENLKPEQHKVAADEISEVMDWMEANPEATKDELASAKSEIESILSPLIRKAMSGAGTISDEQGDWYDEEL